MAFWKINVLNPIDLFSSSFYCTESTHEPAGSKINSCIYLYSKKLLSRQQNKEEILTAIPQTHSSNI